jgi:hypothetical protein
MDTEDKLGPVQTAFDWTIKNTDEWEPEINKQQASDDLYQMTLSILRNYTCNVLAQEKAERIIRQVDTVNSVLLPVTKELVKTQKRQVEVLQPCFRQVVRTW